MIPIERMLVEWQCQKVCMAISRHIDERRPEAVVAGFTVDALAVMDGRRLEGRAAILEALRGRPANLRTRHLTAAIHFTEVGERQARAVVYNVTYFGEGDPPAGAVPYAASHGVFVEYHDVYRLEAEGWRLAERVMATVLAPEKIPGR
jgi:hypothetical protein